MRERVPGHGIETIVAAALLQRGAGGDLARLLRDVALALEDHARVEHDARAATAQARFTGLIVVLLPIGGGLLAELASPGYLMRLGGSFLTAWLAGPALLMPLLGAGPPPRAAHGPPVTAPTPGRLGLVTALAGPLGAFFAPDWWLARRAAARARLVRRQLPAVLDLLRVSIEAGLSPVAALAAVGARSSGPLAAEWRRL